jgi:hypothetical protein
MEFYYATDKSTKSKMNSSLKKIKFIMAYKFSILISMAGTNLKITFS